MDKEFVGNRIRQYRKKAGYTQEKLAERVGLGSTYISSIECGSKTPKLETFLKIAQEINASPNDLLIDYTPEGRKTACSLLYEKIEELPNEKYQLVMNILEAVLETLR